MKLAHLATLVLALGVTAATSPGCSGGNPTFASTSLLEVVLASNAQLGTPAARLPIPLTAPTSFTVTVTARNANGTVDSTFNGFVRVSVKPGNVQSVSGPNTEGRNVKLVNGVATGVVVTVQGAFGDARVVAEDLGYIPADPLRKPPPLCANGIDDNNNGLIDYPADPGCAFANDDTEDGGTYSAGASETIHFAYPRVADVRGIAEGGGATAFPNQQVEVNTGWNTDDPSKCPLVNGVRKFPCFVFDTIVTRIAGDGFYLTDVTAQAQTGYASVFAYNFSPPPGMRVCDRLKAFGGTSSDFFGFTEINYPTWSIEEWDPNLRPCGVPEPHVLSIADAATTTTLLQNTAALVRVGSAGTVDVHVTKHFGPDLPVCKVIAQSTPPLWACAITDTATNCDLNHDGKVDFTTDPEKTCATTCDSDTECTEYSSYLSKGGFGLVMKDSASGALATIQGNGLSANNFNALLLKGQTIGAFTGTLRYFSGGSQFTIEARCDDDIVADPTKKPLPSDQACVFPRSPDELDDNSN